MASVNETTVHLPAQKIDVTLRVDYLDHVAVEQTLMEKLDSLGIRPSADGTVEIPFSYGVTKKSAILRSVPKEWTWKNPDGSNVPLNETTINRLPITDVKVLVTACSSLYDTVSASLRNAEDPKD